MTPKPTPRAATWFLYRFASNNDDESVMGDLFEQYQRGRGSFWYWRQVLSIVFGGMLQEFRRNKWNALFGLFSAWCVWGILQFAGMILMVRFVSLHPEELHQRVMVNGFPFLTIRIGSGMTHALQWGFILLLLVLNTVPLLLVGRYCARRSRVDPRTMLIAFISTYVLWDAGWMVTNLIRMAQGGPGNTGLIVARDLIALPLAAALIAIGGMRGLSPVSPEVKR
jgi:hypothetical protein